jgi:hypothetical protein
MSRGATVVALLAVIASCRTPPPRPAAPLQPLALGALRFGQPVSYELAFTPGATYSGLELVYLLLGKDGAVVHRGTLEAGPIFDRGSLAAGRPTARRIRRPEDEIKVVGRPRPVSPLGPGAVDFDQVTSARLVRAAACRLVKVEWMPGDPLPPGVNELPARPTTFLQNICNRKRGLRDPSIDQTFRFERVPDRARAWIDVTGTFNEDFPSGASFVLDLLGPQGQKTRPACALHVQHPPATRGQEMSYHVEFDGEDAVDRFRRVRSLQVRELARHGGDVSEVKSQLVCGPR